MLVIPVVGFKGGSSKTTSAVFLAHALHELGGTVLLVDADPQQSAAEWQQLAPAPFPFDVVRLDSPSLDRQLPDYVRHRYDTVVIDCPPRDQHAGIVAAALRVASVAVVPMAPVPIEYRRLGAVQQIAGRLPLAVLLTRTVANAASTEAYRGAVKASGMWCLRTQVGRRELYAQAFADNVYRAAAGPYGDAAQELLEEVNR